MCNKRGNRISYPHLLIASTPRVKPKKNRRGLSEASCAIVICPKSCPTSKEPASGGVLSRWGQSEFCLTLRQQELLMKQQTPHCPSPTTPFLIKGGSFWSIFVAAQPSLAVELFPGIRSLTQTAALTCHKHPPDAPEAAPAPPFFSLLPA